MVILLMKIQKYQEKYGMLKARVLKDMMKIINIGMVELQVLPQRMKERMRLVH